MYVVTGASGQLGRLVIDALLTKVPATEIVAAVRNPDKVADLATIGVVVRTADYTKPDTLKAAFADAKKVLLISSSEVGQRLAQHQAVIDAAKTAGVELLAYTSILGGPNSSLLLAQEHVATEAALAESGVPHVILRNGWYSENFTAGLSVALEHGAVLGCSGDGTFSTATRADYAAAAAAALTLPEQAGKVYELAGDDAYTMTEFASLITESSGKSVVYQDMPEAAYAQVLEQVGLPAPLAGILADASAAGSRGDLCNNSRNLSTLIGRPTTPIQDTIKAALTTLT